PRGAQATTPGLIAGWVLGPQSSVLGPSPDPFARRSRPVFAAQTQQLATQIVSRPEGGRRFASREPERSVGDVGRARIRASRPPVARRRHPLAERRRRIWGARTRT